MRAEMGSRSKGLLSAMRQVGFGVDEMCSDTVIMYATGTLVDGEIRRVADERQSAKKKERTERVKECRCHRRLMILNSKPLGAVYQALALFYQLRRSNRESCSRFHRTTFTDSNTQPLSSTSSFPSIFATASSTFAAFATQRDKAASLFRRVSAWIRVGFFSRWFEGAGATGLAERAAPSS